MLAELAAANAAFGVIKSFVSNGKELASCGKHISDFVKSMIMSLKSIRLYSFLYLSNSAATIFNFSVALRTSFKDLSIRSNPALLLLITACAVSICSFYWLANACAANVFIGMLLCPIIQIRSYNCK